MEPKLQQNGHMVSLLSEKRILRYAVIAIALSIIVVMVVAAYFIITQWYDAESLKDISKTGPLGDALNGITAPVIMLCIATLTFLAFYVQYDFNKAQLSFNRSQLTTQSFFELFKMHNSLVSKLSIPFVRNSLLDQSHLYQVDLRDGKIVSGKDYFAALRYTVWADALRKAAEKNIKQVDLNAVMGIYNELVYQPNISELGNYFRSLYNIFKFISSDPFLDAAQKKVYYNLVRAQLSEDELFILHYNLEHHRGKKFKEMLEKEQYNLLKHIAPESYIENHVFNFESRAS